jgi:uncharacterized protein YndB with AHSA1/START domain
MTMTVRREVVLPVAPEEVWPALTEAEQVAEWFGADVELDLRPGGPVTFRWADATRRGVVEAVEPNRRFAFRWAEPDDDDGEVVAVSTVEFRLEAIAAGTRLQVTETGLHTGGGTGLPAMVACMGAGAGWDVLLQRLPALLTSVHAVAR